MRKIALLAAVLALLVLAFTPLMVGQAKAQPYLFGEIPEGYVVVEMGYVATQDTLDFSGSGTKHAAPRNTHSAKKFYYVQAGKSTPQLMGLTRPAGIVWAAKGPGLFKPWIAGNETAPSFRPAGVPIDTTIAARKEGASIEYPVRGYFIAAMDSCTFKMAGTDTLLYGVLYPID